HRAPKGRLREREYWRFFLGDVRGKKHADKFFARLSAEDISPHQKEAGIWDPPTWKMGVNGGRAKSRSQFSPPPSQIARARDPFGVFRELGGLAGARRASERRLSEFRPARNAQRKALDALGLEADASAQEVKTRFKMLVKRHHPDANGGDRSSEERLREIIQAYNYLKSIGFRRIPPRRGGWTPPPPRRRAAQDYQ